MKDTDVETPIRRLRDTFASGTTRSVGWRLQQLSRMQDMLREKENEFCEALRADLGKSPLEAFTTEIGYVLGELAHAKKNIRKWVRREKIHTPMVAQPGSAFIQRDPLGLVLIIAPWNYPLQLLLAPLIGAIAAGNCAVVKPSEVSSATANAIARWLPEYLDPAAVSVVLGGVPETTALLAQTFDHIFYTGNGAVGRIVMEAAAKNLTPVTLELGGKSPTIVDETADLNLAARRIIWGKFTNAGQTCIAPDYILVHRSKKDELLRAMSSCIKEFYGTNPEKSADLGHVINERHFERLEKLMSKGKTVCGGETNREKLHIAPTVFSEVPDDAPIMQEEIFGPLLPVRSIENVDEAIEFVNARPKPLALYVFSSRKQTQDQILNETSSGGACINDVLMHYTVEGAFGGVGPSGMGGYHGHHSFETFSHRKTVLRKSGLFDPSFRYPPYNESKAGWLKRFIAS